MLSLTGTVRVKNETAKGGGVGIMVRGAGSIGPLSRPLFFISCLVSAFFVLYVASSPKRKIVLEIISLSIQSIQINSMERISLASFEALSTIGTYSLLLKIL